MKWFNNPKTLEELKKQYKRLAMENHPDVGGNETSMKQINVEYDSLFKQLKNVHQSASGETYTAKTDTSETPEEFRTIIEALIKLDGINIELCGSWLWISGNTYPHRAEFKKLHFRFSKSKTAWYYHTSDYKKTNNKTFTMEQIRELYGSQALNKEPQLKLHIV